MIDLTVNIAIDDLAVKKNSIAEKAKAGIINVRFTKVNGEERNMRATLLAEYLPNQMDVEEVSSRINQNVLTVWDIDNNGWRSFRIDSVKEVLTE